jgi:hypothetical protein
MPEKAKIFIAKFTPSFLSDILYDGYVSPSFQVPGGLCREAAHTLFTHCDRLLCLRPTLQSYSQI